MVYSNEQLNFFRICHIIVDILPLRLCTVFKQEWDRSFKVSLGEWHDTVQNGTDFYNRESASNQNRNARLLNTMTRGNTSDWDCTCLFYGILYSDSVGSHVSAAIRRSVDDLRIIRNNVFAHRAKGSLTNTELDTLLADVVMRFSSLGLPTSEISAIIAEEEFTTERVERLKAELELQRQWSFLLLVLILMVFPFILSVAISCFKQVDSLQSFYILPSEPSHVVVNRTFEVEAIVNSLQKLSNVSNGTVSAVYISGNSGSGKDQVAKQVAEIFRSQISDQQQAVAFVATLNGETVDTLLTSYIMFLEALKCPEEIVTSVSSSDGLTTEEKLSHLMPRVLSRVKRFSTWLLIIDDVVNLAGVHDFWPQLGSKDWGEGQLLITTTDTEGIPPSLTHASHISLSDGMQLEDCLELLKKVSNLPNTEGAEEVCQVLDRQPLALAGAADFVRYVSQSGASLNFTWFTYLEMFERDQQESTESVYEKSRKHKGMTTAIRLQVERTVNNDVILRHAFQFMSLCAPKPLPLSTVVKYVTSQLQDHSEHLVAARLTSTSLVLPVQSGMEKLVKHVRVHRVVFGVIKKHFSKGLNVTMGHVETALRAAHSVLPREPLLTWKMCDYLAVRNFVPHLDALLEHINSTLAKNGSKRHIISPIKDNSQLVLYLLDSFRACHAIHSVASARKSAELSLILVEGLQNEELRARVFTALGTVYKSLHQFETSKEYYRKSLIIREELYASGDHLDVAASLHNLGMVNMKLGNIKEARNFHERSLAMKIAIHGGSDHYLVANSLNQLCLVYADLGEMQMGLDSCHRALEIRHKFYGTEHPIVSFSLTNLGNISFRAGQLKQAIIYYAEALAIRERIYGRYDYRVAECLYCMGIVYESLGEITSAVEYHERSLKIREKVFGKKHTDVAESEAKLSSLHKKLRGATIK